MMESKDLRVFKETEAPEEKKGRKVSRENQANLAPALLQPTLFR
jgi:hypothetical protein